MCGSTLDAQLAEHRYQDSSRRSRVHRRRPDLGRHRYWLRAAFRRIRHDNPFNRIAPESPEPWNPLHRNASCGIVGYSEAVPWIGALGPCRLTAEDPPILCQFCAKGPIRRSARPTCSLQGHSHRRSNPVSLLARRAAASSCHRTLGRRCVSCPPMRPPKSPTQSTARTGSSFSPPRTPAADSVSSPAFAHIAWISQDGA